MMHCDDDVYSEIKMNVKRILDQLDHLSNRTKVNKHEIQQKGCSGSLPSLTCANITQEQACLQIGILGKELFCLGQQKFLNLNFNPTDLKFFISEMFLLKVLQLAEELPLKKEYFESIEKNMLRKIFPYLKAKYSYKKEIKVSLPLWKAIQQVNEENIQCLLMKSGINFDLSEQKQYDQGIMTFLNYTIELYKVKVEQMCRKKLLEIKQKQFFKVTDSIILFEQFKQQFDQILFKANCSQNTENILNKSLKSSSKNVEREYIYTSYFTEEKNIIDLEIFSEREIEEADWKFKNSQMITVINEWCKQLRKQFKHPVRKYQHTMKDGSKKYLSIGEAKALELLLKRKEKEIQLWLNTIRKNNYNFQRQFSEKKVTDDPELTMLSKEEILIGMFAAYDRKRYEFYLVNYLKELIHHCLTIMEQYQNLCYYFDSSDQWNQIQEENLSVYIRKGKEIRGSTKGEKQSEVVNLLSFKLEDIPKCKVTAEQKQIQALYHQILRIERESPYKLKLISVKKRLRQEKAQIILKLMFNKHFLVEVHLKIACFKSKFYECYDIFKQYISDLEQNQFGCISECCQIWRDQNPCQADFFLQHIEQKNESIFSNSKFDLQDEIKMKFPLEGEMRWKECKDLEQIIAKIKKQDDHEQISQITYDNISNESDFPEIGLIINKKGQRKKARYFKCFERQKHKFIFTSKGEKLEKIAEITNQEQIKKLLDNYLIFIHSNFREKVRKIHEKRVVKQYFIPELLKQTSQKKLPFLQIAQELLTDEEIDSFEVLESVKTIDFSNNALSDFKKIVEKFPNAEALILNNNEFQKVQCLQCLTNLKHLNLSNNDIREIDLKNTEKQLKLESVNLNYNKLTNLPQVFFKSKSLRILQIKKNKLKKIPDNFGDSINLEQINFENNKLQELPFSIQKLKNLKIINLSSNELTGVNWLSSQFENLRKLNLENNNIYALPPRLGKFSSSACKLDLSGNRLKFLPINFQFLKNLATPLDLSENDIEQLPEQFGQLVNLPQLNLSFNKLTSLPNSFGKLKELQIINLRGNNLSLLPDSFCDLIKLTYLNIRSNQLAKLPQKFGSLVNLETLNLRSNKLSNLPNGFSNFVKLKSLHLYENQIEKLPQDFTSMISLEELLLQKNQLRQLPESFGSLRNLSTLNISQNQIEVLPISFGLLSNLRYLYIRQNELHQLPNSLQSLIHLQLCSLDYGLMDENTRQILNNLQAENQNFRILA